jgi:hypothetical protein
MKTLLSTIPDAVLSQIEGKKVIEASMCTGPGYMIFAANTFDPPAELETGLEWLKQRMPSFKGAALKLDDFSVLWFWFNKFDRYQMEPVMERIRPTFEISGHEVEPIRVERLRQVK